jgi:diacylglycerol kinase family enzyme
MQTRADSTDDHDAEPRDAATPAEGGETHSVRRRFLIIHNPLAGRNRVGLVRDVVRHLELAGAVVEFLSLTETEADTDFGARLDAYDAVIASGGDGTARSVASLLHGRAIPLGVIPAGTGNVLAAELDLPRDSESIAHMLLQGPVVRLSIGAVNGSPFLLMIGVGFDGHVIARLPLALKRQVGRIAFGWPVIVALARKPQLFSAMIDGRQRDASWIVVANAARYGGRFVLSPRTNVVSPGFNVVMSRATSRRQRLWELLSMVMGRLEQAATIEMRPAREIEIHQADALPVQVDGEPLSSSSYRIEADISGAAMIVPRVPSGVASNRA